MDPRDTVTCNPLRATLSAESCAKRHLARVGIHGRPGFIPCGTCSIGAAIVTMLLDRGWRPANHERHAETVVEPTTR